MIDYLRRGLLVLIAILGLGLGVVACDNNDADDGAATDTTTDETTTDDGG